MSCRRSRSGGTWIGTTEQAEVEVLPEAASAATSVVRSRLVAAITRTSTWSGRGAAHPLETLASSSTRSSLGCSSAACRRPRRGRACRRRPARSGPVGPVAPVKAPFSWPNSSLSIRSPGCPAQLTSPGPEVASTRASSRESRAPAAPCRCRSRRVISTPACGRARRGGLLAGKLQHGITGDSRRSSRGRAWKRPRQRSSRRFSSSSSVLSQGVAATASRMRSSDGGFSMKSKAPDRDTPRPPARCCRARSAPSPVALT